MQTLTHLFTVVKGLFNPETLQHMLQNWGFLAYYILFAIVFSETGLLVGFCLPGDSLLFIAGFVCSVALPETGHPAINLFILMPLLIVAAIAGDNLNYWLGRRTGPMIFNKEDSLFFHKKHLVKTQKFYEKYGGKTMILARFVPFVRTFAPFVAGMGKMDYMRFVRFDICGAFAWICSMMLMGYFLGNIPWVKHNLEKAVILVIFISILPIIIEMIKAKFFHKEEAPPPPAEPEDSECEEKEECGCK